MIQSFVGNDLDLVNSIRPVLQICTLVPLLVALQNATQGFLVSALAIEISCLFLKSRYT